MVVAVIVFTFNMAAELWRMTPKDAPARDF